MKTHGACMKLFTTSRIEGCLELQIRQLIQDGNKFFQRAPKGRYKDLKTLDRLTNYTCEVKSNLRQESAKVEQAKKENDLAQKEKEALEEEKARLLRENRGG
ncbi:hypothetical protein NMY22_g15829 [Coprinellus aureogranulatus]|nr:hypothetical protein NMY22_g15829 [Coprinellus aureogranulatus]